MKPIQKLILVLLASSGIAAALGMSLVFSSGSVTSVRPQKTAQENSDSGDYYYREGEYQKAVACYRKALELDEDLDSALRGQGTALMALNYNDDAEEIYAKLCSLETATVKDDLSYINVLILNEKFQEAKDFAASHKDADETGQIASLYENMTVPAPELNLSSGEYSEYQKLEVTNYDQAIPVYYTTDGSEPTKDSNLYNDSIIISFPENHIKIRAVNYLGYMSDVVNIDINITKPVELIKSRDSLFYSIVHNALKKNEVYNYDLAQITELYIINRTVTATPKLNYTFYNGYYTQSKNKRTVEGKFKDISILKSMPFLKKLVIGYQKELDLGPLSELYNLEELSLLNDSITDISAISGLYNLKKLSLGWNNITDISAVSSLNNLEILGLWSNQITDITPVQGLTSLQYLDIADNQVSDISAVNSLSGLSELWIYNNSISDFSPIQNCTNLKKLMQTGNPGSDKGLTDQFISNLTETDWGM